MSNTYADISNTTSSSLKGSTDADVNMQTCLQNMITIRYTKQIPKNDITSYNKNDSNTLCKVNIKEFRKNEIVFVM
jgi:hypothetical protein